MNPKIIIVAFLVLIRSVIAAPDISTINIGTAANDDTGDSLRTAFGKINTNFNTLSNSIVTLTADVTAVYVNGTEVSLPNFTNSATVTWTRSGTNITATASGSGGGTVGTVINTGTPAQYELPYYKDTTGTNVGPSGIIISSSGPGINIPDSDASHYFGVSAFPTTTTNAHLIGSAFPPPTGSLVSVYVSGTNVYLTNSVSGGTDNDAIHDNVSGEIAAITDKATPVAADHLLIEDSAASDAKKDITIGSLETPLEGALDLQDLQGAVTDAQVPNNITVNLATTATTAEAGDSATAFFSSGEIEDARLPSLIARDSEITAEMANVVKSSGASVANDIAVFNDITRTNIARSTSAGRLGDNSSATYTLTIDGSGTDVALTFGSASLAIGSATFQSGNITVGNGGAASYTITGDSSGTDSSITLGNNNISASTDFFSGGQLRAAASPAIYWNGRSAMDSGANGNIRISNLTQNDFGLLRFGGTSSSFPALKRSGTGLQVKLADDSALSGLTAGTLTLTPASDTTALTVDNNITGSATGPAELHRAIFNTSGAAIQVRNLVTNTASAATAKFATWETVAGGVQAAVGIAGDVTYNLRVTKAVAGTIASAATIAPTAPITFISGTTTIDTITAPTGITSTGGSITLIPTGLWSTSTSGNVALSTTAVVNKALTLFYDATTTKWYPSY